MTKLLKKATPKARPYWHVDAKWIFGLLLGSAVIVLLWVDTAVRLTDRETAVPLLTRVVALQFSPDGLDDQADLEKVRGQWLASGQSELRPIEGMPLVLTREQVEMLPARELRLTLFRQMAEPLYDNGVEGFAASISSDPARQKEFANDAKLLGLASHETHDKVSIARVFALVAVLLLLVPAIYFSAGLGRLITPGVVLILASWAGALVFGLSKLAANSSPPDDSAEGMAGMIGQEVASYLPTLATGWAVVFGTGIGLLVAAASRALVRRWRSKRLIASKAKL